jgi:hypothetical protein
MPHDWEGHPCARVIPGRATEMAPYTLQDARVTSPWMPVCLCNGKNRWQDELIFNIGPHHVSTHGVMRYIVALAAKDHRLDMDIGYHHRAAEKIGERQTWHQFIPYTDRVDYLAGRPTTCRTCSGGNPGRHQGARARPGDPRHAERTLPPEQPPGLVATAAHDVGAMSPNFYTFREREMIMDIVE